jgi:hypothetical protein
MNHEVISYPPSFPQNRNLPQINLLEQTPKMVNFELTLLERVIISVPLQRPQKTSFRKQTGTNVAMMAGR